MKHLIPQCRGKYCILCQYNGRSVIASISHFTVYTVLNGVFNTMYSYTPEKNKNFEHLAVSITCMAVICVSFVVLNWMTEKIQIKYFRIEIWIFLFKICFRNQF